MQRLLMLAVAVVVTIYSASAIADSSQLKGTYGFTSTNDCLYASGGFNASFQALGTATSTHVASQGVATFNGDGTGTFNESSMSITPPPTVGILPDAGANQSAASFTYAVTALPTFTVQIETFTATVVAGPRVGQTFNLQGSPLHVGTISADGRTLVTSILTPGVETLTSSNGDVLHRICTLSSVFINLDADWRLP
jgi:hypothetical protein